MRKTFLQSIGIRNNTFVDKQLLKDIENIKHVNCFGHQEFYDYFGNQVSNLSYAMKKDYIEGKAFAYSNDVYTTKQKLTNGSVDEFRIFFYIGLVDVLMDIEETKLLLTA